MRSLTATHNQRRHVHRPHHNHHHRFLRLPELCHSYLALLLYAILLLSFRNDSDNRSGWCLVGCFLHLPSIVLRHSKPRSSQSIKKSKLDSTAFFMSIGDDENNDNGVQKNKQEYRRTPIGRITTLDRTKIDASADTTFYQNPNFVTHTDNGYIKSLQDVYRKFLPFSDKRLNNDTHEGDKDGLLVLDLMSSHVSHFPQDVLSRIRRVDVHGMNREELLENNARRSTNGNIYVRDLNANPSLVGLVDPLLVDHDKTESSLSTTSPGNEYNQHDRSHQIYYDAVTCCVGIQYLQEPEAVLAEVGRVLRPNTGVIIISFTNRFFYQKAIQGWINRGMNERARLVKDYIRAAGGFDEDDIQIVGDGVKVWNQLGSIGGLLGDPFVAIVARRNGDP